MFVFIASTLIAALALWQALLLPPAIFEPLGPSTVSHWSRCRFHVDVLVHRLHTAELPF